MTAINSQERTISGRKLVLAMFTMGIVGTMIMWLYWSNKMTRFMPLQQALVEEYEKSAPRVDWGREKGKSKNPLMLLVQMRVPFDPTIEDEATQQLIDARLKRSHELAIEYEDLSAYEEFHLFLYHEPKQKDFRRKLTVRALKDGQLGAPVVKAETATE